MGNFKNLTHYTSKNGFESIITNKKLWFTDINYLNDYYERILAIEALKERCEFSEFSSGGSNEHIHKTQEKMNNLIDSMFKSKRSFVFSCSSSSDDLAMWNYYSKNSYPGGYNFSFNLYDLASSIVSQLKNYGINCNVLLGKVYYSKAKLKKIVFECENFMNDIYARTFPKYPLAKVLYSMRNDLDNGLPLNDTLASYLAGHMSDAIAEHKQLMCDVTKIAEIETESLKLENEAFCDIKRYIDNGFKNDPFAFDCFFKNKSFSFEKEYRLVIQINQKEIDDLIALGICKFRHNHDLNIPYLEIEFDTSVIKKICIAPTNKDSERFEYVTKLLERCGINAKVVSSKIPVRY